MNGYLLIKALYSFRAGDYLAGPVIFLVSVPRKAWQRRPVPFAAVFPAQTPYSPPRKGKHPINCIL